MKMRRATEESQTRQRMDSHHAIVKKPYTEPGWEDAPGYAVVMLPAGGNLFFASII